MNGGAGLLSCPINFISPENVSLPETHIGHLAKGQTLDLRHCQVTAPPSAKFPPRNSRPLNRAHYKVMPESQGRTALRIEPDGFHNPWDKLSLIHRCLVHNFWVGQNVPLHTTSGPELGKILEIRKLDQGKYTQVLVALIWDRETIEDDAADLKWVPHTPAF
jgi:hypothetical protein